MQLIELPDLLAICRLPHDGKIPDWANTGPSDSFLSVTRTSEELSIVCNAGFVPNGVECEAPWRCFRVAGKLDFSLVGVINSLTNVLAAASISVFVISTYDTDYVLVQASHWDRTVVELREAGFDLFAATSTSRCL